MKKKFRLQRSEEERIEATTRRRRRRIREDKEEASRSLALQKAKKRKKTLLKQRAGASLANALKQYREDKNYTRTELAEMLGITRRALFNYETGARPVPGDILETLVKKGDAELHQLFAVPYEPAPEERKGEFAMRNSQLICSSHVRRRSRRPICQIFV